MTTTPENERIYLQELGQRWGKSNDEVLALAIKGKLALWVVLNEVFQEKRNGKKKKKDPAPKLHTTVELRPLPEILTQIQGRSDRILVAAELVGLNQKGKTVSLTNAVGNEWGHISMLGLPPHALFARRDEVLAYEGRLRLEPAEDSVDSAAPEAEAVDDPEPARAPATANTPDHPCFARELHIALACWQALFAGEETEETEENDITKTDILAWIQDHHPNLTQAARQRIAMVVFPTRTR